METTLALNDFLSAAKQGIIIDVRTPAEFANGHIQNAVNIPLFTNDERAETGTLYIQKSPEAAIERGLEMVGPKMVHFVRQVKVVAQGKPLYLYCWRGGMRSNSMAWLMRTAGMQAVTLVGGYKAYRNGLQELVNVHAWKLIVIGGYTGCGKTEILQELARQGEQVIDLEALAVHRGSAFGALGQEEQPSTEAFGNYIHAALCDLNPQRPVWCEGESSSIGRVFIPNEFFALMDSAPYVFFEIPLQMRLKRLSNDYGNFPKEKLTEAFLKIKKRLGGERMTQALSYLESGDMEAAAAIALTYYDKGYKQSIEGQHNKKLIRIASTSDNPVENAELVLKETKYIYNENN